MRILARTLLLLALLGAVPAFAQTEPPARVGRVSLVSGALAYFGPEDGDWSAAKINLPVAEGAWFATDLQSRAELRIGAESVALAPDTQLNIAELREKAMQLALTQGRIDLQLRSIEQDETAEIDMPRGGLWLTQPGVYDVDSGGPDQPTKITVFEGSAHFVGGGVDTVVNAGDALVLSGIDTLSATVERAAPDEFVRWCRSHDWHEQRLAAPYHVSPAMTGYEELDAYGEWDAMPSYGEVWFPKTVPADWAPYREGRWVWIEPWGWNWVDDEPWGFAPFHYGRWARIQDRWAWVPGEFVPEPVYAPALVAFIPPPEIETAVPVAADAGPPVGWFPLAPGEVYWPSYTRDPTYIRNVNITNVNVTTIANITKVVPVDPPPQVVQQHFANRAAATVVPATLLAASAPVAKAAVAVAPQVLQRASVSVRPPPVVARPGATASAPNASAPGPAARATGAAGAPVRPPARPNFAQLAPAPRLGHPDAAPQPVSTQPAAQAAQPAATPPGMMPAHPPGPPDFAHLPPARLVPHGPQHAPQQPAQVAPGAAAQATPQPPHAAVPDHPSRPPDFARLPPTHRVPPPAGQGAAPTGHEPAPAAAAPAAAAPEHAAQQRAGSGAARQQSAQQAQQRAASDAAARQQSAQQQSAQQAQQRAASDAAARQQAQQRAAGDAARQQRAAADAARQQAAQQAQQRAAADAARQQAAQQAQQRAAADAARQQAAQQAQQRAAADAARQQAAQQAQQRAAADAARQQAAQQAQQRGAAEAAARQQAAQQAQKQAQAAQAAQSAARQKQAQACGHPGQPPCPH